MTNYYLKNTNENITQSANFKFDDNCLETEEEIIMDNLSCTQYLKSDYDVLIQTEDYIAKVLVKENATKIVDYQSQIKSIEEKIQRSIIAKTTGTATDEDNTFFNNYVSQITDLRKKIQLLITSTTTTESTSISS